ncbi:hypothetical protein ACFUCV_14780 [Specibacter sp. NPDC057265]|uniref:hypothetical protein n=1 Tax=Specibacter sp. NPDC057265 TaxID=3346075 RepID=UPI00363DF773
MTTLRKSSDDGDRILADLRALIEQSPAVPPRPISEWNRNDQAEVRAIGLAWGWLMRVVRTSEAIRILEISGYDVEAAPLRRSVFEHVIRMHWATTLKPGVFVEAGLNHRKWSLSNIKRAAEVGIPLPDGAPGIIEMLQSETDLEFEKLSFKDLKSLMGDLPGDYWILYQNWLTETQESHATMASASAYVSFDQGSDHPVSHLQMKPGPRAHFDAMLPSMVLLATESYAYLTGLEGQLNEPLSTIRERVTQMGTPKNN